MISKPTHKLLLLALTTLSLSACSMSSGHVPSAFVVLAPVAKATNSVSSRIHNHKINNIKHYLSDNYDALKQETYQGNGAHLERLIQLTVKQNRNLPMLKSKLQQGYQSIFKNSRHVVMRMNAITAESLANGQQRQILSYQTRMALLNHIDRNYDSIRLAIKNQNTNKLNEIANILFVPNNSKTRFYHQLFKQYDSLFLDHAATRIYQILTLR